MPKFVASVFALWALTACVNEPHQPIPASFERAGHVYMFRGLVDFMSLGIDEFMGELRSAGINAAVYSDLLGAVVAARIEREYAHASTHEPVILLGYSSGVETVVSVARRLNRSHIPVVLLVTLDPPVPATVPPNVRSCMNYYERTVPGVLLLSGSAMRAQSPTEIENIRLNQSNHFTVDESREMRAAVLARIKELCPLRNAG